MRKFVTLFMTLALFGLFSGSLFAGKVAWCEDIKFNPAYKGLYGLCNAFWNADERSRARILENFYKKAGPDGPGMPGLDDAEPEAVCPCWAEGQIDFGATPDPDSCLVAPDFLTASYDLGTIQYEVGGFGVNSCQYSNFLVEPAEFELFYPGFDNGLTAEELEVCSRELMARLVEDFGGCL
ncbi:MAG: hypothetical protein KJN78_14325 [Gammaproteobacteria bacterium]|nr:hypothetical protein [Gammaproteobacteria bacterium]